MLKLVVYKTSDGKIHEDFRSAERYADNRYGNALTSLAHQLVRIGKFKEMVEFLENHLEEFVKVQALKDDIPVTKDDDIIEDD